MGKTKHFTCKNCSVEIYLDDEVKAPSGKRIPLEFDTDSPHQCQGKPDARKEMEIKEDQQYSQKATERTLIERVEALEKRIGILEKRLQ